MNNEKSGALESKPHAGSLAAAEAEIFERAALRLQNEASTLRDLARELRRPFKPMIQLEIGADGLISFLSYLDGRRDACMPPMELERVLKAVREFVEVDLPQSALPWNPDTHAR